MTKSCTRVVKLRIEYDVLKLLYRAEEPVEILHDGRLGNWIYHSMTPAIVHTEVISPECISRLATYDLIGLTK